MNYSSRYIPVNIAHMFTNAVTGTMQAYKHVFTSPSSVDSDETKATKSGNARIHGMSSVTPASIIYIATQASTYIG